MSNQLAFGGVIDEAEHAALDAHRAHVDRWFQELPVEHKRRLRAHVLAREYETWRALSAAVNDWRELNGNAHREPFTAHKPSTE